MATGTTGQNQPAMTYPDVYFYMHGVNPALAGLLDMGCRMGKNVQEVLATMREVEFGDPAAKAAWVNAIEVAKGKIQQWGAGLCTWSDPRSTALAAVSSRMPALPTAAQNAIAAANIAAMQQNQQASGYSFQPGGQQPAAGTIDDGHTHPWDGGRCEVLEGGARCGPIEGGHCGKKCGGACDSCLRPAANGNKMCMWDAPAPSSP